MTCTVKGCNKKDGLCGDHLMEQKVAIRKMAREDTAHEIKEWILDNENATRLMIVKHITKSYGLDEYDSVAQ